MSTNPIPFSEYLKIVVVADSQDEALRVSGDLEQCGYDPRFTLVSTEAGLSEAERAELRRFLAERDLVRLSVSTSGYFDYRNHFLGFDLLRFLSGAEAVAVRADARSAVTRDTEDYFVATLRFEPGPRGRRFSVRLIDRPGSGGPAPVHSLPSPSSVRRDASIQRARATTSGLVRSAMGHKPPAMSP